MSASAPVSREAGSVDRMAFRTAMSRFATGVAVLTASHEGQRFGMTINSLTSVSLDPCQILVCVNHGSATGEAIKASGIFAVSLLEAGQTDVSRSFVGRQATRFETVSATNGLSGAPLIEGALATITCQVNDVVTSGDHEILIGDVIECDHRDGDPLVFFGGKYGCFERRA
jgi:3-hydroxy-9,10-secoandrosta-1,3,5(10)-triene-9,17-dione monooxygenase reductase component